MRALFGLASFLVILPAGAAVLLALDVLHTDSSHGRAQWLLLSACAALVLVGAMLAGVVGLRSAALRRPALAVAASGLLGQFAFLALYGVPFTG